MGLRAQQQKQKSDLNPDAMPESNARPVQNLEGASIHVTEGMSVGRLGTCTPSLPTLGTGGVITVISGVTGHLIIFRS